MSIHRRVESIVKRLSVRGVNAIKITPATEASDPAIWITESIYIQVGTDYTVVFRARLGGLASYDTSNKTDDIMKTLKQAIDEGKGG